jgi:hypothetical protein
MKILFSCVVAYLIVGYGLAWRATPISRPFGIWTLFLAVTWPVAFAAQFEFERTGKWPKWYPAL